MNGIITWFLSPAIEEGAKENVLLSVVPRMIRWIVKVGTAYAIFYIAGMAMLVAFFVQGVASLSYAFGMTQDNEIMSLTMMLIKGNFDSALHMLIAGQSMIWIVRLLITLPAPYLRRTAIKIVLIGSVFTIGGLMYHVVTFDQPWVAGGMIIVIMIGILAELGPLAGKMYPDWKRQQDFFFLQRILLYSTLSSIAMFGLMTMLIALPINAFAYASEWAVGEEMYADIVGEMVPELDPNGNPVKDRYGHPVMKKKTGLINHGFMGTICWVASGDFEPEACQSLPGYVPKDEREERPQPEATSNTKSPGTPDSQSERLNLLLRERCLRTGRGC